LKKTWNDSEMARLSAYLDRQLTAILDRLDLGNALTRKTGQEADDRPADCLWAGNPEAGLMGETDEPEAGPRAAISPAGRLAGKHFLSEDLDFDATLGPFSPIPGSAMSEDDWLEPELLGEPEVPDEPEASVGLTPEAVRELSRIIEAAVEKGVAAALAKIKY
jgi:hypothetical protein